MYYVVSDIHNDCRRLNEMLRMISFSEADHLCILGDLFDRCSYDPDPVGVYFTVLRLADQCTVLRGNHDVWLAQYILNYYNMPEKRRKKIAPYPYNSFELLQMRLTPIDIQNLAQWILSKPCQAALTVNGSHYRFAHDAASLFSDVSAKERVEREHEFFETGTDGYISVLGHDSTQDGRIWKNRSRNVYCIDCGCGYRSGKLGCLCLDTMEEFYVE